MKNVSLELSEKMMREIGVVNCRESDVLRPDRFCSRPRIMDSVRIGVMGSLTTRRDRKRDWRSMVSFSNFQVGMPNKCFCEAVPHPLLAHLHAPSRFF